MKKGRDYQEGDVINHGSFEDKVLAVWSEHDSSSKIYLVTGNAWKYLTIYAVDRDACVGPRLARYIPMQLFLDLDEDMRVRVGQAPRKRKKPAQRKHNETSEEIKPAAEVRRRNTISDTPTKAKKTTEEPALRRRIQKRK